MMSPMKKLLAIVVLGVLFNINLSANETNATCIAGECEFMLSIWYDYAETTCLQSLINERVHTGPLSFEIIETGQTCMIFNER
jgi:hypothetical protein